MIALQVTCFDWTIACIVCKVFYKLFFKVILRKHIAFYQFLTLATDWSTFKKWSSPNMINKEAWQKSLEDDLK